MFTPALVIAALAVLNAIRLSVRRCQVQAVTRPFTLKPVKPAARILHFV